MVALHRKTAMRDCLSWEADHLGREQGRCATFMVASITKLIENRRRARNKFGFYKIDMTRSTCRSAIAHDGVCDCLDMKDVP
jgi:hypothetical protein